MNRFLAAAIILASLAPSAAFACKGRVVSVASAIDRPPLTGLYGKKPLTFVTTGTNAPEALVHVYSASAIHNGIQRLGVYHGPCANQGFREIIDVATSVPAASGSLYFVVPEGTYTAAGFEPKGAGWALRPATATEQGQFQSCKWD